MKTLLEMSSRYKTDKAGTVDYLDHYEKWFAELRERPISLLEMGGSKYRGRKFSGTIGLSERVGYKLAEWLRTDPRGPLSPVFSFIKRQLSVETSSHYAGMVGFVKELFDECAVGDIYHSEFGLSGEHSSMIKEMVVMSSHMLVVTK